MSDQKKQVRFETGEYTIDLEELRRVKSEHDKQPYKNTYQEYIEKRRAESARSTLTKGK